LIHEKRAPLVERVHGDRRITGATADASKGLGIGAVGLGSDKFTFRREAPEVCAAAMEVGASEGAEGTDELSGIGVMKSGARKLQQKLLESLVRLRRVAGTRVSGVSCQ